MTLGGKIFFVVLVSICLFISIKRQRLRSLSLVILSIIFLFCFQLVMVSSRSVVGRNPLKLEPDEKLVIFARGAHDVRDIALDCMLIVGLEFIVLLIIIFRLQAKKLPEPSKHDS